MSEAVHYFTEVEFGSVFFSKTDYKKKTKMKKAACALHL